MTRLSQRKIFNIISCFLHIDVVGALITSDLKIDRPFAEAITIVASFLAEILHDVDLPNISHETSGCPMQESNFIVDKSFTRALVQASFACLAISSLFDKG